MQDLINTAMSQVNQERAVKLARALVDIPSNTGDERECAEFLVSHMKKIGLEARLQPITETRANAIGIIRGSGEGPTLMFNGHLDTGRSGSEEEDYAALGGPIAPGYKPKSYMKSGFIFGLGANNMKGGVAAAVTALDALLQSGVKLKGDVIIAGVAGESEKSPVEGAIRSYRGAQYEGGGFGTKHLMSRGPVPDYAVVCEPSGCYVINAQAGYFFVKITVKGKAEYTARRGPEYRGVNAIEKAYAIVKRLQDWDAEYAEKNRYDSGMGIIEPHVNIGAIEGGWPFKPSYASGICNLYLDLRLTPAMNPSETIDELAAELKKLAGQDPQLKYDIEVFGSNVPSTSTPSDHYLVQTCLKAQELVLGKKQEKFPLGQGTAYNDTNVFRWHGIPAVKCGPSGGKVPPGAEELQNEGERLSIEDLVSAAKIYVAVALNICTRTRQEITA
ncbi:MAG: M20/M25/M40 family metallo-hydrolase [Deltaproteobacteria bacterium]|nr:M20/M25/M40 family metallo-hydrolase [Deltaproteobacteria bacterium]